MAVTLTRPVTITISRGSLLKVISDELDKVGRVNGTIPNNYQGVRIVLPATDITIGGQGIDPNVTAMTLTWTETVQIGS